MRKIVILSLIEFNLFTSRLYFSMNNTANHPNKKRKYTDSPNGTLNNALLQANLNSMMNIKQEPGKSTHQINPQGECIN